MKYIGRKLFSIHCSLVFNSYLKLQVRGRENLPGTPYIICSNHQSHLDGIVLAHVGAGDFSKAALVAAKDYWYDNRARYLASSFFFRIIPINRAEPGKGFDIREVTTHARHFFDQGGRVVVILPEGARSAGEHVRPFKNGIVMMAKELEVPIVPVFIDGSARFWPKGKHLIRPGKLKINVGHPIYLDQLDKSVDAAYIRDQVIKLSK